MTAVDLDDAQADIMHSMSSDDRQTKAEYQRGCAALAALLTEISTLRASAAEGRREWIACSERIPDPFVTCVVLTDGEVAPVECAYAIPVGHWYDLRHCEPLTVTHWMPLPSPPEKGSI